jgi:hypothetical protein
MDGKEGDHLMDKLASVLEPMKEDFIVVKMREECKTCMKVRESSGVEWSVSASEWYTALLRCCWVG